MTTLGQVTPKKMTSLEKLPEPVKPPFVKEETLEKQQLKIQNPEHAHLRATPIPRTRKDLMESIERPLTKYPSQKPMDSKVYEMLNFGSVEQLKMFQTPLLKMKTPDLEYDLIENEVRQPINWTSQAFETSPKEQSSRNEASFEEEDEQQEEQKEMEIEQILPDPEQCQQNKLPIEEIQPRKITPGNPNQGPRKKTTPKRMTCNCKKTKCLQLYCDCFRVNLTCDGCNCLGCHNTDAYQEQRQEAIGILEHRNPDAFKPKIQLEKHSKGCQCRKSNCQKKYCECFQAGLKCGQNCKCQDCKNQPPAKDDKGNLNESLYQEKNKRTVKKTAKFVEF